MITMNSNNLNLNTSIPVPCLCDGCKNQATKFLYIIHHYESGFFCDSCASDLKWHGIAAEIVSVDEATRLQHEETEQD